jgi:uncharacterized membrane protein YfcA
VPDPSLASILICTLVAFVAGVIDAMAGGGGIFTMPALASLGLPVHVIAGTNKVVATGGSSAATVTFLLQGKLDRRVALVGGCCSLVGAVAGALCLIQLGKVDQTFAKGLFGALLVAMALYMFFRPRFGGEPAYEGFTRRTLLVLVPAGLLIGFYDGFFGPGTGSFLVFVMVRLLRFDFVTGTGNAKAMNFASNIASLVTFILGGTVLWSIAIPMAIANAAGAWVGSTVAIRQGARFVRWAFLLAALAIAGRMLWFVVTGA